MNSGISEKDALLSKIKDAFWLNEPPKRPEAWETFTDDIRSKRYWEGIEETQPFWGKDWSSLRLEDFAGCRYVFAFLPKKHVPYFVGGYMTKSLKGNRSGGDLVELLGGFRSKRTTPKSCKTNYGLKPNQNRTPG